MQLLSNGENLQLALNLHLVTYYYIILYILHVLYTIIYIIRCLFPNLKTKFCHATWIFGILCTLSMKWEVQMRHRVEIHLPSKI